MPGGTGAFGCLPGGLSLSIQSQENDGRGSAAGGRGSEVAAIRLGRLGCSIWSSSSNSWGAHWVRCHRPADLTAVVTLAEDHLAANPGPSREEPQRSDRVLLPRLRHKGGTAALLEQSRQRVEHQEPVPAAASSRSHGEPQRRRGRNAGSVVGWGTCAGSVRS